MAKTKLAVISLIICLCLTLMSTVHAVSTDMAMEPINTSHPCDITITYSYETTLFSDIEVSLYHIATISEDYQYTLTDNFSQSRLQLNGIQNNDQWDIIRSTLKSFILQQQPEPIAIQNTDETGKTCFNNLTPGLYFTTEKVIHQNGCRYYFSPVLVSVPNLHTDGTWKYTTHVTPKQTAESSSNMPDILIYKVTKLWNDDGNPSRPNNIDVSIFKDNIKTDTITLSSDNNWSHSWSTKNDGSIWTIVEENTPDGYTMTVDEQTTTFLIINTYQPEPDIPNEPDPPENPPEPTNEPDEDERQSSDEPQTGDTSNPHLYTILMCISGTILVILSITGKRKKE